VDILPGRCSSGPLSWCRGRFARRLFVASPCFYHAWGLLRGFFAQPIAEDMHFLCLALMRPLQIVSEESTGKFPPSRENTNMTQGKKILLVDLGSQMGGVEVYLQGLSGMLREHTTVLCLCVLPELAQRLRLNGVKVIMIPRFAPGLKGLRFLLALGALPLIIFQERVQIVLVNGFLEAILLLPARLMGCDAIYTRHGPFEDDLYKWYKNPARYFPRLLSRVCVQLASHVICVSEATGKLVRDIVPVERTTVIPNWVSRIPPYTPRVRSESPDVHLLFVGRLERYKGLHLLLRAMRSLPGTRLTVLGDGSYRKELEHLAAGMRVCFEGFQSNPEKYYAEADIFVMPSLGPEGLPMVTIEAMAHGLPCLFSDLEVHREITAAGTAGMLFRSGDVEDLRYQLSLLIEQTPLRAAYSQAGYRRVEAAYNPDVALRSYLCAFGL
jgi:glycosyltransferase involved in cell wall biosynthesis